MEEGIGRGLEVEMRWLERGRRRGGKEDCECSGYKGMEEKKPGSSHIASQEKTLLSSLVSIH